MKFLKLEKKNKISYVEQCLGQSNNPILAASDYMRSHSEQIRPFVKNSFYSLGTDGFGRSDTREKLREFFEVDARFIVIAALNALVKKGNFQAQDVSKDMKKYGIKQGKADPLTC